MIPMTVDIISFNGILKSPNIHGAFMARIAPDDWVGLENTDGTYVMFRGSFQDVIETFVPYSGQETIIDPVIPGVVWTQETGSMRIPLHERRYINKPRSGLRRVRMP